MLPDHEERGEVAHPGLAGQLLELPLRKTRSGHQARESKLGGDTSRGTADQGTETPPIFVFEHDAKQRLSGSEPALEQQEIPGRAPAKRQLQRDRGRLLRLGEDHAQGDAPSRQRGEIGRPGQLLQGIPRREMGRETADSRVQVLPAGAQRRLQLAHQIDHEPGPEALQPGLERGVDLQRPVGGSDRGPGPDPVGRLEPAAGSAGHNRPEGRSPGRGAAHHGRRVPEILQRGAHFSCDAGPEPGVGLGPEQEVTGLAPDPLQRLGSRGEHLPSGFLPSGFDDPRRLGAESRFQGSQVRAPPAVEPLGGFRPQALRGSRGLHPQFGDAGLGVLLQGAQ